MFKTPAALILIAITAIAQPIPKKYDPETLRLMQADIAAARVEIASIRAGLKELKTNSQRAIQPMQILQKVNAVALSLKALEARVDGLDITLNSDRITKIEDILKHEAEERHNAWIFLKWLMAILGANGAFTHVMNWLKGKREKKEKAEVKKDLEQAASAVKADIADTKKVVDEVKIQTNGVNDKLRAENAELRAQVEALKKS